MNLVELLNPLTKTLIFLHERRDDLFLFEFTWRHMDTLDAIEERVNGHLKIFNIMSYPRERLLHAYTLDTCPCCGTVLEATEKAPRVIQQIEIVEMPVSIEEHRGYASWCPSCRTIQYAPFPPQVAHGGLFGAKLTLVAHLKGVCHASFSTIRKFLRDVLGSPVSRGHLRNMIATVSDALELAFDDLLNALPAQATLHIDETGHKDNGERFWTSCFKASMYTLFRLDTSRGSQVLLDVLGEEFCGIIGCDYFRAYRKYMGLNDKVAVQFCLAHLVRDVNDVMPLSDPTTKAYGERLRRGLKALFKVIHRHGELESSVFHQMLEQRRDALVHDATTQVPDTKEARNIAKRLNSMGHSPSHSSSRQRLTPPIIWRNKRFGSW